MIATEHPDLRRSLTVGEGPSAVHYQLLSLATSEHLIAPFTLWLSVGERMRAARFHQPADRERFILGRGFVRARCAEHFQMEPAAVVLEETAMGKPHVSGGGFEFNVSHSGDCVLVAWSAAWPVGVDVQEVDGRVADSFTDIAEVSFSLAERAVLTAASERDKAQTFYRIWVRKEAIIKAEGVGLGAPLQDFSVVSLESGQVVWAGEVAYPNSDRIWKLVDVELAADYLAALAVKNFKPFKS